MDGLSVAVAGFVVGVALFANPALAEDPLEAPPDRAAAPEYTVSPPRDFPDVKLAAAGRVSNQSVAVNPKNAKVFVSAYENQGTCWVRTSTDAGKTWAAAKKLPMPPAKQNCATGAAPAVLWAPDGSRIYAAYTYSIPLDSYAELGTIVSSSTNNGATWSVPVIATKYAEAEAFSSVRLATPLRASDAKWVYLVSEFYWHVLHSFDFVRSSDMGKTWSVKQSLDTFYSTYDGYDKSPSIAGGLGGEVLVAWGNWDYSDPELFYIAVARSTNYGTSFSPPTVAVPNAYGNTAVAFGNGGVAHLVYDDSWSSRGVFYSYSTKTPRTTWATPIPLSDEPAQDYRYPALFVNACGGNASVLHVVWSDDRVQTGRHNVYYTRKVAKTGEAWSSNLRVSGGELPYARAAIAAGSGTALGVWGTSSYSDNGLPAWASRIAPGVSCP